MKKLIAILLLAAMMISALAIGVSAEAEGTTEGTTEDTTPSVECVESQKRPD